MITSLYFQFSKNSLFTLRIPLQTCDSALKVQWETYRSENLYFFQLKYMQCSSSVVEPRHTDLNRNKTKDTLAPKGLQNSFRLKTDLGTYT